MKYIFAIFFIAVFANAPEQNEPFWYLKFLKLQKEITEQLTYVSMREAELKKFNNDIFLRIDGNDILLVYSQLKNINQELASTTFALYVAEEQLKQLYISLIETTYCERVTKMYLPFGNNWGTLDLYVYETEFGRRLKVFDYTIKEIL